jgi:NitT/TauT family transport system substrate-binding protein
MRFAIRVSALAVTAASTLSVFAGALQAAEREISIVLSFPNGVAWPYFSVANEMGYAKAEGISFKLTATDGSAASYKAVATKQADMAMTQPAQVLNGLALGEKIVSFYTAYQGHVYQFAAPASSPYKKIADLKGQKIGISSVAGGQFSYLRAALKDAGLDSAKDVQIVEVGRGGTAAVALRDNRVAAYSASFVDMMQIEQTGEKLRPFREGPTATFFSDSLVSQKSFLDANPKLAVAAGRAIAKATVFCMTNAEACWTLIAKEIPDTARKPDFTKPLLNAVLDLHRLPPSANGKWGNQSADAWQAVEDFLIDGGQLKEKVSVKDAFTNAYIDEINNFDQAKVKEQAQNQK